MAAMNIRVKPPFCIHFHSPQRILRKIIQRTAFIASFFRGDCFSLIASLVEADHVKAEGLTLSFHVKQRACR
uniref:Uncharacterized protein n=1 Tax=Poecilia mexicana TaxID=48701 RepID=A0A3B3YRR2_9TELE